MLTRYVRAVEPGFDAVYLLDRRESVVQGLTVKR
jgi:hypothetical protein